MKAAKLKKNRSATPLPPAAAVRIRPEKNGPASPAPPPAASATPELLLQENASDTDMLPVRFSLLCPEAREVFVAGSFNRWNTTATALARYPDGTWAIEILLTPGSYEYRFIVDGQWRDDPAALRSLANPFGGTNSVIEVTPLG